MHIARKGGKSEQKRTKANKSEQKRTKANKSEDYQKPAKYAYTYSPPAYKRQRISDNTNFPKCLHREDKIETVEIAEVL